MPVMPVQPCLLERIAYAADTSAGKRKYFDRLQIVFDARATSIQFAELRTISRVAGATAIELDFDASGFRDPTLSLETAIEAFANGSVREQARSLLRTLKPIVLEATRTKDVPPLRAIAHEDGSASIEWALPGRRLTFSFEPDPTESGWLFVSSPAIGGVLASGKFFGADLKRLVDWAVSQPNT